MGGRPQLDSRLNATKANAKLMEEFGELCGGIAKNKPEVIKDSIGDCFVALVILTKQLKVELDFGCLFAETYKNLQKTNDDQTLSTLLFISRSGKLADCIGYHDDPYLEIAGLFSLLTLISSKLYLDLSDCIQHAYDQIKDRKGVMREGIWIKSEDLDG